SLPSGNVLPLRDFSGPRFVRHIATEAQWAPWQWLGTVVPGFVARDTGIGAATSGLASVLVVRGVSGSRTPATGHAGELLFLFLLKGTLQVGGTDERDQLLEVGDCVTIPAHASASLSVAADAEFLQVMLPAA
ncbi:MAG: hypothetical protein ABL931_08855, partial [Usitatibacteraceae bacterium]